MVSTVLKLTIVHLMNAFKQTAYSSTGFVCIVHVCVHARVRVYGQSDRYWTARVTNSNAYWAALLTGGWHKLLVGRNSNVWEVWNGR